ncbi:hypothetical protein BB561_001432 [Smittium simulii]|uniref:Checkpoint protein n=1 Tax=Smittium simulii TaxID=133385 RepID=A0A2T9YUT2_9FUNG|nr:hypothetical protein BB561_001432 [Smittium simulii]
MKFKAQLHNNTVLYRIAQSLAKLGKTAVVQLSQEFIKFIYLGESEASFQLFAPIYMKNIFVDYNIQSAHDNTIYMEFQVDNLIKVLKSAQGNETIAVRLLRKQKKPYLTFKISGYSRSGRTVLIVQDIPVRVLTPVQMSHIREPVVPQAQVNILLPPINNLRSVAERIKSVGQCITISASNTGKIKFHVASEIVDIEVFYRDLINPILPNTKEFESDQIYQNHLERYFSCTISTKNFVKFLYAHYIVPASISCVLIENHAIIFTVYVTTTAIGAHFEDQGNACGALTYYIPAFAL